MNFFLTNTFIKPISFLVIPPSIVVAPVVKLQDVVLILIILFITDFITGLLSSYFAWCKTVVKGKYFFGQSGGFSSDKFKKSFVKGMVYGGFPLIVLKFQDVFLIKNLHFDSVTNSQLDITTVCILVFCANELFSIFWENLPGCGLNIPQSITKLFRGVKDVENIAKE